MGISAMTISVDSAHYYVFAVDGTPWAVRMSHAGDDRGWVITLNDARDKTSAGLCLNSNYKIGDRDFARNLASMVAKAIDYIEGNQTC